MKSWFRSLEFKILLLVFVFIGLFVVNFVVAYKIIEGKKQDTVIVSLVNRQEAGVHKYTKEFFYFLKTMKMDQVKKTITLFEGTLNALKNGGDAPKDYDTSEIIKVPAPTSKEIIEAWSNIEREWNQHKELAATVISSDEKNIDNNYAATVQNSDKLAGTINKLIKIYQDQSQKELQKIQSFQLIMIFISLIVCVIAFIYFRSKIISAIVTNIAAVKNASHAVATDSADVAEASQHLADGANQQTSSIQETSASLEELSGMVSNNVENAEKTFKALEEVQTSSHKGTTIMKELVKSMDDIMESNAQIQELVKIIGEIGDKTAVIDEIVFQTKLLSFNASVEAERAGEYGRGFAVVAQEVGNLAQMSGKAALEISSIVKDSITNAESITTNNKTKVEAGGKLVHNTAGILQEIETKATQSTVYATQILEASKEQSTGIKQISSAVSHLDQATQDNALASDKTAKSSDRLNEQAESLNGIVGALLELVTGSKDDSHYTKKLAGQATKDHKIISSQNKSTPSSVTSLSTNSNRKETSTKETSTKETIQKKPAMASIKSIPQKNFATQTNSIKSTRTNTSIKPVKQNTPSTSSAAPKSHLGVPSHDEDGWESL